MASPFETGTAAPYCGTPEVQGGPVKWSVKQAPDRSRVYSVTYRVRVAPTSMGPLAAMWAAGLPAIGSVYTEFGVADDWAYFTAERDVEKDPMEKDGGNQFFLVTCTATNRPDQGCTGWEIDNPFAIPDRIRVESVNYQKEGYSDKDGNLLVNSAFEKFRGKEIEYDAHRIRVVIEGNRPSAGLTDIENYMNHVNDRELWGYPARHVKLSHYDVEPKYYDDCTKYWINKWTFDVSDDFDRCIQDEGTKALRGQWIKIPGPNYGTYELGVNYDPTTDSVFPVDPKNPRDFIRYKDWHGENTRVILDGNGVPYEPGTKTGIITGASNATPIVMDTSTPGLVSGTVIVVSGVLGNTAANGTWVVTPLSPFTFALFHVNGGPSVGNGPYTPNTGIWSWTQDIGKFCFKYYPEANMLDLGIPSVLDPSP